LAANRAATSQGGAAAAATPASATPGTAAPLGHVHGHGHGHGGKHENIQSLIDELNASSGTAAPATSGTATSGAVANLNSAFSKLITDLGAASSGSNAGTATALSIKSSSPPLRGLLQTLLQHVQQQGSFAASAGNLVHTAA
jgi:hypothetical protein